MLGGSTGACVVVVTVVVDGAGKVVGFGVGCVGFTGPGCGDPPSRGFGGAVVVAGGLVRRSVWASGGGAPVSCSEAGCGEGVRVGVEAPGTSSGERTAGSCRPVSFAAISRSLPS